MHKWKIAKLYGVTWKTLKAWLVARSIDLLGTAKIFPPCKVEEIVSALGAWPTA